MRESGVSRHGPLPILCRPGAKVKDRGEKRAGEAVSRVQSSGQAESDVEVRLGRSVSQAKTRAGPDRVKPSRECEEVMYRA